jgi:hypothetical protein
MLGISKDVIDRVLRVSTLLVVVGVMVKVMFFGAKPVTYPDYSGLLEKIEMQLNAKMDSLGINIGKISVKIDESRKKETILIDKRKDIVNEKQDNLKTISAIGSDTTYDVQRDESRDKVLWD